MVSLEDPISIGPVALDNRLYRAPLLECAANDPDAADILQRHLEPAAATGTGLIFQGACLVTAEGGRTAPGLTRVHDDSFVAGLEPAVEAIQDHGAQLFCQIGHGALQSMELWHTGYREAHPDLTTYAIDDPPWWLRALWHTPILHRPDLEVMSEHRLATLAERFGEAAGRLYEAGYDGIHLAGANASIFQQLWSPVFNGRSDAYGGDSIDERSRFLREVVTAIRDHTEPGFPVTTKIPCESEAPGVARQALDEQDTVQIAKACQAAGIDAVVPVRVGATRDQSVARGRFPDIAWNDDRFQSDYDDVFGSSWRKRLIRGLNRLAAKAIEPEPAWNADLCKRVREAVDVPVLCEGGIRERSQMDQLLAEGACDAVGMARPFYAEPRIAHRILHEAGARVLCESCNNCTIPQIAGADGVCRTPTIMAQRGEYAKQGRYDEPDGD
ncbi:NADH-dependent flavin oxidoreductase [Thermoplasmatales archaeon SW_10_69_26]|nr:MAG: NADH-dependent flavin oxidoreductase [Thermoplasmatales archaeon SW_10_69_26]